MDHHGGNAGSQRAAGAPPKTLSDNEIAKFLATYPPFDSLTACERDELAAEAEIEHYQAGTIIVDGIHAARDRLRVVYTGEVGLWNLQGDPADGYTIATKPDEILGPGGVFGYTVILSGSRSGPRSVALKNTVCIRLPGEIARPVFSSPAGTAYLARELTLTAAKPQVGRRIAPVVPPTARELIRRAPVMCDRDTSIRRAAETMTEMSSSYIVVHCPTPDGHPSYGLVTDLDIRSKVVARGLSADVAVTRIAEFPAPSVQSSSPGADVLIDMLEFGRRYMLVTAPNGSLLGVIHAGDFQSAPSGSSFQLRRRIEVASQDELVGLGSQVRDLIQNLNRENAPVRQLTAIMSVIIDSLVRRSIFLELQNNAHLSGDDFTWLSLGSVARREAMLSSDADSAAIVRQYPGESERAAEERRVQVMALAARVHAILESAGVPTDRHGATASKALFTRTESGWMHAAQDWIADPFGNQAMMMASLTIDGRPVWGHLGLQPVASVYLRLSEHRRALKLMLQESLTSKARMRSMRDVLSLRGGTFDIKAHGITPIVNIARWAALSARSTEVNTRARLHAGAGKGLLDKDNADTLLEVFDVLERLRMDYQIRQIHDGREPTDVVTMKRLSPLERSLVAQSVREVATIQKRLANLAAYVDVSEW